MSAWAYLFGQFNSNATPLAPLGTRVIVHLKPETRSTWAPNGENAWSIGPSLEHYRCITCYFPKTRSEHDCDTVTFIPKVIPFTRVTTEDFLRQAATEIVNILSKPYNTIVPSLTAGNKMYNALLELAKILNRAENDPKPVCLENSERKFVWH